MPGSALRTVTFPVAGSMARMWTPPSPGAMPTAYRSPVAGSNAVDGSDHGADRLTFATTLPLRASIASTDCTPEPSRWKDGA